MLLNPCSFRFKSKIAALLVNPFTFLREEKISKTEKKYNKCSSFSKIKFIFAI